ncbi:MAG TPA: hypothetical protein VNM48_02350 [Chloroflexota bacterium]|nr:hypothetical protein [Chloroflexota bacterium]
MTLEKEVQLKLEGMDRASAASDPVWREYAYGKLLEVAARQKSVHVDDLHAVIEWHPASPNAWGGVWQRAIRRGVLAKTGLYRPTRLPGKHAHDYPCYRSLVYGQREAAA